MMMLASIVDSITDHEAIVVAVCAYVLFKIVSEALSFFGLDRKLRIKQPLVTKREAEHVEKEDFTQHKTKLEQVVIQMAQLPDALVLRIEDRWKERDKELDARFEVQNRGLAQVREDMAAVRAKLRIPRRHPSGEGE